MSTGDSGLPGIRFEDECETEEHDVELQQAIESFHRALAEAGRADGKSRTYNWTKSFQAEVRKKRIPHQEALRVLWWYTANLQRDFIPQANSIRSFFAKYDRIRVAIRKEEDEDTDVFFEERLPSAPPPPVLVVGGWKSRSEAIAEQQAEEAKDFGSEEAYQRHLAEWTERTGLPCLDHLNWNDPSPMVIAAYRKGLILAQTYKDWVDKWEADFEEEFDWPRFAEMANELGYYGDNVVIYRADTNEG